MTLQNIYSTLFFNAAKSGNIQFIESYYLLKLSLDITDEFNNTALIYAVINNRCDIIKFLLIHNANTRIKNVFGFNANDYFCKLNIQYILNYETKEFNNEYRENCKILNNIDNLIDNFY